jgi:hypothetical protein
MHKPVCAFAAWALVWPWASALGQTTQQELLQKLATVEESVARNQAALREFTWTERTVTSVKGEIRRIEVATCGYRPDDRFERTRVSESEQPEPGLKAKIFEMKSAAVVGYTQRLLALLNEYLPPSPRLMSAAHQAGSVSFDPSPPGTITLNFWNYLKPGDSLIFKFDSAARSLRKVFVNTYLGDPKDKVTLLADFAALPDGTNYVSSTTLNEKAKGIQIVVQNSGYQRTEL